MSDNSGVKKLVQITEEVQKPIQIPIIYGSECFVITQQDVRKIEDTRYLTFSRLTPTGQLIPMETPGHSANITEAIFNAYKYRMQFVQNPCASDVNLLVELLNRIYSQSNVEYRNIESMQWQQSPQCVASLEQQLQWSKIRENSSKPFPFTYSKSTSASDMPINRATSTQFSKACCCCCCCKKDQTANYSRGCNTVEIDESRNKVDSNEVDSKYPPSSDEQLKKQEMPQDSSNAKVSSC